MSDQYANDPFASPAPSAPQFQETPKWQGTPQWQGTPVPPPGTAQPLPQIPAYVTAGYPPPPPAGYLYATNYSPANTSKNWMGITSLILSAATVIVGITFIPGVILGHMGLAAAKRGEANNKGVALAGALVGWFFVGITLVFIGVIAVAFSLDTSGS